MVFFTILVLNFEFLFYFISNVVPFLTSSSKIDLLGIELQNLSDFFFYKVIIVL